uniref:Uncharacterized protein n=1 Tax=Glossina austeni TaxID=7395 RepID=A0A1A9UYH4_GLOAU
MIRFLCILNGEEVQRKKIVSKQDYAPEETSVEYSLVSINFVLFEIKTVEVEDLGVFLYIMKRNSLPRSANEPLRPIIMRTVSKMHIPTNTIESLARALPSALIQGLPQLMGI